MALKLLQFLIILNLYFLNIQCAKRRFSLEIYNFTCPSYGKRSKHVECSFKKFSNKHYSFTEGMTFDRDMGRDLKIRVWIEVKRMQKYIRFIDVKIDACSAISHAFEQPFLKTLIAEYKKITNLPTRCPFKGNYVYKMDNLSFTTNYIPVYAPEWNFTFGFDFYDVNTIFSSSRVTGLIVNK